MRWPWAWLARRKLQNCARPIPVPARRRRAGNPCTRSAPHEGRVVGGGGGAAVHRRGYCRKWPHNLSSGAAAAVWHRVGRPTGQRKPLRGRPLQVCRCPAPAERSRADERPIVRRGGSYWNNSRNAHNSNILQVILRDHGFHKTEPPDDAWNIFWCAGQVRWRLDCVPRALARHPRKRSLPADRPAVAANAQALPKGEQVSQGERAHAQGQPLVQLLPDATEVWGGGLRPHAAHVHSAQPARAARGTPRHATPASCARTRAAPRAPGPAH